MIKHLDQLFKNSAARATGIIFALCGLGFGTWASLIPYVKEKFSLDEAQLGLLLLSLPVGTFVANPSTVFMIKRWGAVRVALSMGALTSVFFAIPIATNSILFAIFGLFLAGFSFGITNVAMNTCASLYQDKSSMQIMSACHGMWSVGAMCGALFSGLILIPLEHWIPSAVPAQTVYALLVAVVILIVTFVIRKDLDDLKEAHLQTEDPPKINLKTFRPTKDLWVLIIICLCSYLTEGTMADWSAVYLREMTLAPETIAGWGFALYAFCLASGRFMGDSLLTRYGGMRVLRSGGILVFAGLLIVIFSYNPWPALPGFMLVGMGISLASPILYGSAAKLPGMAPGIGLATLNTFAMASFLGGPVLIGFIAKMADLRISFMVVAFAAIIWIIQTTRVIRAT